MYGTLNGRSGLMFRCPDTLIFVVLSASRRRGDGLRLNVFRCMHGCLIPRRFAIPDIDLRSFPPPRARCGAGRMRAIGRRSVCLRSSGRVSNPIFCARPQTQGVGRGMHMKHIRKGPFFSDRWKCQSQFLVPHGPCSPYFAQFVSVL